MQQIPPAVAQDAVQNLTPVALPPALVAQRVSPCAAKIQSTVARKAPLAVDKTAARENKNAVKIVKETNIAAERLRVLWW